LKPLQAAAILAALALAGCKKDGLAPTVNRDDTRLELYFTYTNGDMPLGTERLVRDYVNTLCRVDEVRFMLSSAVALDAYGLPLGSWPQGTITADLNTPGKIVLPGLIEPGEVHFLDVRLGPADPRTPLASMLCDTTTGVPQWTALYVKGIVDSNDDDHITEVDEPFVIRCALPAAQEVFRVHAHTLVVEGRTSTLSVVVDVRALLYGIDVADEPHCISPSAFNNQALVNLTTRVLGEPN
jgi:hypothetical protein